MKKAAAYIRVSTDDQTEYSPASQQKAILEYAAGHNYVIPDEYIFTDEGISGRSTNRPSFQKMIGMAKSEMHPFDAIIVWKFSRFARNREDSIVYKSMLRRQYGIDVISVSEQLGVDKTSILIEALLEAMDEYYSINLAEEVVRGMSEKARRGGAMGAAAYGYIIKNGILIPDPEHAPIIREIFEKYAATGSIHLIAEWLNASGIPTRSGKKWTSRSVEYILRNVTYTGTMHWTPGGTKMQSYSNKITEKTIFSESPHEAIIPADLFEAVQKKIENTKRKYSRHSHRTHGRMFALKGLVRCSSCGSIMCMSAANHGLQCRRYACGECGVSHFIKLDTITQMVINRINYDFPSDKFKVAVPEAHFKKNTYEITASVPALLRSDIPEELKNEILHSFIGKIIFDRKNTAITIFYLG